MAATSDVAAATVVDLCRPHREAIDGGEVDWRWDWEDRMVLMDADLSGDHIWLLDRRRLQYTKRLQLSSRPSHTFVLQLDVRRWGSTEVEPVELMLSREELAGLRDIIGEQLELSGE